MPDLVFEQVLNYKAEKIKLSDLKGKLVLLDFWFTGCTVCIQQFPKLQQLQNEFGGRLFILPIGFDVTKNGTIKAFLKARKGTPKAISLPVAIQSVNDSLLLKLFPFEGFPHEVWIDSNGTIIGITDQTAVTKDNIKRLSSNRKVTFNEYRIQSKLTSCSPFLVAYSRTNSAFYCSAFSGYIDTLKTSSPFNMQCDSSHVRLFEVNKSVYAMYKDAYQNNDLVGSWNKRIVVENAKDSFYKDIYQVADSSNWVLDNFRRNNLFCYELIMPNSYSLNQAYLTMITDLDRHFNIVSKMEKRTVKCLSLQSTEAGFIPAKTGDASQFTLSEDQLDLTIKEVNIKVLITHLNNLIRENTVLNETGYTGNITINLHLPAAYNLADVNNELSKYKLTLKEVYRDIDMLVLLNKNN